MFKNTLTEYENNMKNSSKLLEYHIDPNDINSLSKLTPIEAKEKAAEIIRSSSTSEDLKRKHLQSLSTKMKISDMQYLLYNMVLKGEGLGTIKDVGTSAVSKGKNFNKQTKVKPIREYNEQEEIAIEDYNEWNNTASLALNYLDNAKKLDDPLHTVYVYKNTPIAWYNKNDKIGFINQNIYNKIPKDFYVQPTTIDESAPPGMEDLVLKLKKQYPTDHSKAYATAWNIYNKKKANEDIDVGTDVKFNNEETILSKLATILNSQVVRNIVQRAADAGAVNVLNKLEQIQQLIDELSIDIDDTLGH